MNNFELAPGLPGYGTKGTDGSAGLIGLGLYFTGYNGDLDTTTLSSKISLNKQLVGDASLPGWPDRVYLAGDMFIDKNGKVFEITVPSSGTYSSTDAQINTTGIFEYFAESGTGYERYVNSFLNPKIITDDVYTSNNVNDYSLYPSEIYGLSLKDYAKIMYSDKTKSGNDYNPYNVWTAGIGSDEAIALVRDYNTNSFRIGNIDASGAIRNVDIIFDASNVKINKTDNEFDRYKSDGTILTNHEIDSPLLFTPVFNISGTGSSFSHFKIAPSGTNDCSIYWNILDFYATPDPAITAGLTVDLCFYESSSGNLNGSVFSMNDASARVPLVFHNIDPSGVFMITNLKSNKRYEAHLEFEDSNGWMRRSNRSFMETGTAGSTVDPSIVVSPTRFLTESTTAHDVDVSVWVAGTTWTIGDSATWISITSPTGTQPAIQGQNLKAALTQNTGAQRTGYIYIYPAGLPTTSIQVTQNAATASTYTVYTSIEWTPATGFNSIWGNIKLKNSGGTTIQTYTIPTRTTSTYIPITFSSVPAGVSYYVDYSGVTAWDGTSQVLDSKEYSINGSTWIVGDQTDTFLLNVNITRYGKIIAGGFEV